MRTVKLNESKIKEGYEPEDTDPDFWYDLTEGGYINQEEILDNLTDVEEVMKAIKIVREFYYTYMREPIAGA